MTPPLGPSLERRRRPAGLRPEPVERRPPSVSSPLPPVFSAAGGYSTERTHLLGAPRHYLIGTSIGLGKLPVRNSME